MNDKDLIRALHGMAVETGSLVCLGCGHEHDCGLHGCAIINEAAARLEKVVGAQGNNSDLCTRNTPDALIHCKDCKHLYYKDMSAHCPYRVGPCRPDGFCDRGVQGG